MPPKPQTFVAFNSSAATARWSTSLSERVSGQGQIWTGGSAVMIMAAGEAAVLFVSNVRTQFGGASRKASVVLANGTTLWEGTPGYDADSVSSNGELACPYGLPGPVVVFNGTGAPRTLLNVSSDMLDRRLAVAGPSSTCPGTLVALASSETAAPRLDANSTAIEMLDVRSNATVWAYNLSTLAAAGFVYAQRYSMPADQHRPYFKAAAFPHSVGPYNEPNVVVIASEARGLSPGECRCTLARFDMLAMRTDPSPSATLDLSCNGTDQSPFRLDNVDFSFALMPGTPEYGTVRMQDQWGVQLWHVIDLRTMSVVGHGVVPSLPSGQVHRLVAPDGSALQVRQGHTIVGVAGDDAARVLCERRGPGCAWSRGTSPVADRCDCPPISAPTSSPTAHPTSNPFTLRPTSDPTSRPTSAPTPGPFLPPSARTSAPTAFATSSSTTSHDAGSTATVATNRTTATPPTMYQTSTADGTVPSTASTASNTASEGPSTSTIPAGRPGGGGGAHDRSNGNAMSGDDGMTAWIGIGLGTAVVAVVTITVAWHSCAKPTRGRSVPLVNPAYEDGDGSGEGAEFGMSDSTV